MTVSMDTVRMRAKPSPVLQWLHEGWRVAQTLAERFDATGRIVQLLDNPATAFTLLWATPRNLQRAIQRAAALMDRNEEVLFLHLTSHGGAYQRAAVAAASGAGARADRSSTRAWAVGP